MKKVLKKKIYQYTTVFEPDKESGGYVVSVPSLPGVFSEGDTFEEALKNIREATILYLETMIQDKEEAIKEEKGVIVAPIEVSV